MLENSGEDKSIFRKESFLKKGIKQKMLIAFNDAILLCDGDRQQVTEMTRDRPTAAAQQREGGGSHLRE